MNIIPFSFESSEIRVVRGVAGSEVVAKDVAEALGYEWNGAARVAHVPDEWKGVTSVVTPGGTQQMITLTEQGLYFFLGRSDKPKALPFQKWIAGEVLPSIRKTGGYQIGSEPVKQAMEAFKLAPAAVRSARALGLDKNAAAISANQYVRKLTGVDLLEGFGATHLAAENQEAQYFTASELGKMLEGAPSARRVNLLLAEAGMQAKRGDVWEVLDTGREFARIYDTGKRHGSGVPIQQIKWAATVLPLLKQEEVA